MDTQDIGKITMLLSIVLLAIIVYSASKVVAINQALHKGCNLSESVCPYTTSIPFEHATAFVVGLGIFALGYKLNNAPKVHAGQASPSVSTAKIKKLAAILPSDEKKIYSIVVDSQGFVFQNDLIEKSGLNKVTVTRLLDKLEGKSLVERRRRGMSNVIVLKHNQ